MFRLLAKRDDSLVDISEDQKAGRVFEYGWRTLLYLLNPPGTSIFRYLYLVVGIAGLIASLAKIFYIIGLTSMSFPELIKSFLTTCIPLIIMVAGFYGFFSFRKDNETENQ